MMNTVILLQTTCSKENIVRLFARFANKYGTLWTTRLGPNPDWEMCIDDWYEDLKHFDYKTFVLAAKSALTTFNDYPPTFGQFEDLCKKHSGFLQREDAIKMLIARAFSHPIVKIMYDKIGSWTLTNGKETEVQAKAQDAYREAKSEFTLFPDKCWAQLESFNAKPKELPSPSKSTLHEQSSLKDMWEIYKPNVEKARDEAKNNKQQKEFDHSKLKPNTREFDKKLYDEYKSYLIGIPQTQILSLTPQDTYARMKFLAMNEQPENLRQRGFIPHAQRVNTDTPKSKSYRAWNND